MDSWGPGLYASVAMDSVRKDYEDQMVTPYIPVIRLSANDAHFRKAKRLNIVAPASRTAG